METVKEEIILKVSPPTPGTEGKGVEGHLVIKYGAILRWKYSAPFFIKFAKDKNPCESSSFEVPNIYLSEEGEPIEGKPSYEVKCIVTTKQTAASFPYGIHPGKPSTYDMQSENGYCRGCCLETENTM